MAWQVYFLLNLSTSLNLNFIESVPQESEPDGLAGVSIVLPSISEIGEESVTSSLCGTTTRPDAPETTSMPEQMKLSQELIALSGEVILILDCTMKYMLQEFIQPLLLIKKYSLYPCHG